MNQATLDDQQIARLQKRVLELENKLREAHRALLSNNRALRAIQASVQEAQHNCLNWQEELRDEYATE